MRRRSERKKSSDVSSPVTASRRTRKSSCIGRNQKLALVPNTDDSMDLSTKFEVLEKDQIGNWNVDTLSEEHVPSESPRKKVFSKDCKLSIESTNTAIVRKEQASESQCDLNYTIYEEETFPEAGSIKDISIIRKPIDKSSLLDSDEHIKTDQSVCKEIFTDDERIKEDGIFSNTKLEHDELVVTAKNINLRNKIDCHTQIPPSLKLNKDIKDNEVCREHSDETIDVFFLKREKNRNLNKTTDLSGIRKRKWISKKQEEIVFPILSISTDSLKNLISDVQPVPLSDINLDSTSEVEEVESDNGNSVDNCAPSVTLFSADEQHQEKQKMITRFSSNNESNVIAPCIVLRSPSPSKNEASNILYITNLVRPFTVLQLKGLLARTGKIIDKDGFWIDRIKSKCYVQYESEDEAIETRHALHGIRWPISNPKCLNVDFGQIEDMKKAILSIKDESYNFGQDSTKENCGVGASLFKDEKKIRPVREWDVGKNNGSNGEKRRERENTHSTDRQKERNIIKDREGDRNGEKYCHGKEHRSISISPVRKDKKRDSDPPLRLLDDLFRKTQSTPCIYWLPLTPEQIAEKDAIRKLRIDEQQRRIEEREREREKERNREKNREKDLRLERSNDRRKSRSRDRRRY